MKTEYRELNAVIKAIWSVKISPNAEIFNALKKAIEEEVKNIEPANVIEVVRCKDCDHRNNLYFCLKRWDYVDLNFYCAYGERRTDDGK